jgi:hypothetical protein
MTAGWSSSILSSICFFLSYCNLFLFVNSYTCSFMLFVLFEEKNMLFVDRWTDKKSCLHPSTAWNGRYLLPNIDGLLLSYEFSAQLQQKCLKFCSYHPSTKIMDPPLDIYCNSKAVDGCKHIFLSVRPSVCTTRKSFC